MKANLYKGVAYNGRAYYEYMNDVVDGSKIIDELDRPLEFIKKEAIKGEIVSWSPFLAIVKDTTRRTFTCDKCGSHNCKRPNASFADPHFYQGSFVCSDCNKGEFYYYSDCFRNSKIETQLSLFK